MLEKAVEKIKNEMTKGNNPYIQVVGDFLLQQLNVNPEAAEKILQRDKTIAKSLDSMKEVARKKAVGGCAMLTDQEGFEIVLKYFGIDGQVSTIPAAPLEVSKTAEVKPAQKVVKDIDFDVSLDDFI